MDKGTAGKITILVPTFNRYRFLLRLLRYYKACGAPYEMHVLDSSNEDAQFADIEGLLCSVPIVYRKFESGVSPISKLCQGLEKVSTAYSVLWGDDDFLAPSTLEHGVKFLEENRDYSVAHGQSGLLKVSLVGGKSIELTVWPYPLASITTTTAAERLITWFNGGGSVFYSIQRTENLRRNLQECQLRGFGYYWGEIVLGCLSMIQGKTMKMPRLYMLREVHSRQDTWNEGQGLDLFGWVTASSFASKYETFHACLSDALAHQDGISLSQAQELVKRAFWSHLANQLVKKWKERYMQDRSGDVSRFRRMARSIPGLQSAWRAARSVIRRKKEEMSLAALLRPSSPYHADFMPMYATIMGQTE